MEPIADNTLYDTPMDQAGQQLELSNGQGMALFTGRTGLDAFYKRRRALLRFDLSGIPPGAQILCGRLTLHQTKAAPGSPPAVTGLHRVLQAWGEGNSNGIGPEGQGDFAQAGDATWHHRIYATDLWDTAGGHFVESASAETTVGRMLEPFAWSGPGLLTDIEFWLQNPGDNFGWILVGGEAAGFSAHRFASRENPDGGLRPALSLVYRDEHTVFSSGFERLAACEPSD